MFESKFECNKFFLIFKNYVFIKNAKNIKSQEFWVIVRAIKEFTESEGQGLLPVNKTLTFQSFFFNKLNFKIVKRQYTRHV